MAQQRPQPPARQPHPAPRTIVAPATPAEEQLLPTRAGRKGSLIVRVASRYGIDAEKFLSTLKATAFRQRGKNGAPPPEITNEQMVALLTVAERYGLDPFVKQIYAFPNKAGGIEPIVPIDGWIKIITSHPQFRDMEIYYPQGDEMPYPWIGVRIWRKDREMPTDIREFLIECRQQTDPWNEMPTRMLRHKAIIQCGRVAFGLAGIYDPDEGERINEAIDVTPQRAKPTVTAPRAITASHREAQAPSSESAPATEAPPADAPADPHTGEALATAEQVAHIRKLLDATGVPENETCEQFGVDTLEQIAFDAVAAVIAWIERVSKG